MHAHSHTHKEWKLLWYRYFDLTYIWNTQFSLSLFFNWNIIELQCYVSFRYTSSDSTLYTLCYAQHKSPYSTVTVPLTIPYAVPFILVTHSFHYWKPVSPTLLHLFCHSPTTSPLATTYLFSVFIYRSVCFILSCFLDSTYKWNHMVFVFLCLPYST